MVRASTCCCRGRLGMRLAKSASGGVGNSSAMRSPHCDARMQTIECIVADGVSTLCGINRLRFHPDLDGGCTPAQQMTERRFALVDLSRAYARTAGTTHGCWTSAGCVHRTGGSGARRRCGCCCDGIGSYGVSSAKMALSEGGPRSTLPQLIDRTWLPGGMSCKPHPWRPRQARCSESRCSAIPINWLKSKPSPRRNSALATFLGRVAETLITSPVGASRSERKGSRHRGEILPYVRMTRVLLAAVANGEAS
jgi:hypothetical protein